MVIQIQERFKPTFGYPVGRATLSPYPPYTYAGVKEEEENS